MMIRPTRSRRVKAAQFVAVAAVLALATPITAPAAHAATGTLGLMLINGNSSGTSAVTVTDQGDVSAEFIGTEYPCDSATASGTATAGDVTSGAGFVIDTILVDNCDTVGGLTLDVTETCDLDITFPPSQTVDDLLIDHAVTGTLNAGTPTTPCLHGQGGSGLFTCNVDIYGQVGVTVDEDKGSGVQNLNVAGSGLFMKNGSGVCSIIPDGTPISLNVDFNFDVVEAPFNFVPKSPLGDLLINGSPSGTSAVTVTDQGDVAAEFLGTEYPCDSATASGTATAGDVTSGAGFVIDDILVDNCDTQWSLILDVTETCDLDITFTPGQAVDDLLVDHAVTGTLDAGTSFMPCLHGQGGSGLFNCNLDVYGQVGVTVDEDKGSGVQNLNVAGSGLFMKNGSGVCSIIPDGTPISLNVDLDLDVAAGPANFVG